MATYEFTGKVEAVGATKAFGAKGFTKRNFVVDAGGKYPNPVQFTLKKDKCELADGLSRGQEIIVKFAVEGRRWDDPNKGDTKYFTDLVALEIRPANAATNLSMPSVPVPPAAASAIPAADESDEMPF